MRISDWSSDVCSSDLVQPFLAREERLNVREERYSLDQWRADAASGRLVESFACGTAAVVTPIGRVAGGNGRASSRERVGQYVEIPVVAVSLKKNKTNDPSEH